MRELCRSERHPGKNSRRARQEMGWVAERKRSNLMICISYPLNSTHRYKWGFACTKPQSRSLGTTDWLCWWRRDSKRYYKRRWWCLKMLRNCRQQRSLLCIIITLKHIYPLNSAGALPVARHAAATVTGSVTWALGKDTSAPRASGRNKVDVRWLYAPCLHTQHSYTCP